MSRLPLNIVIFSLFISLSSAADPVCSEFKKVIQPGDLIFLHVNNRPMKMISNALGSWANHVGVYLGEDVIFQASLPRSGSTNLCRFLRLSGNRQYKLMRLKMQLSETEVTRIREEAMNRSGRLYDLGFNMASKGQFCSKIIYEIYDSAVGIKIGQVETFRQLRAKNPGASLTLWKILFRGRIPWERQTLTPRSQLEDEDLQEIPIPAVTSVEARSCGKKA